MTQSSARTILVVDDSDIEAELLQRVFRRLRPQVSILRSENGEHAIAMLQTHKPDLIIMDIRMPRMGGLEALEHIKRDARLRRIPVIMMSSSKNDVDIRNSYDRMANAYVVKKFSNRECDALENIARFWLDTAEFGMNEQACP